MAHCNVTAMLNLYCKNNPALSRRECFELMKVKESRWLGLDLTDAEVKALTRQENIKKGTFFKKRKRKK